MSDKKPVLVIDDEEEIVSIVKDIYERTGEYRVSTASNGAEAYIKTRNQNFDFICTDHRMPRQKGADLLFALRDQKLNPLTPVLFVTGYAQEVEELVKGQRFVRVLQKPFESEAILKMTEEMLAERAEYEETKNKPKRLEVDANLINHFITASTETLGVTAGVANIKPGKPFVYNKETKLGCDISGMIGMSSPVFKGLMAVSFPKNSFLDVIESMLGERYEEINEDIEDAAGEIINIIYGQTRKTLSKEGYTFNAAMPSVVRGDDHKIGVLNTNPTIVLPFESAAGPFYVLVCVNRE